MFRVVIITDKQDIKSNNFETRKEAEDWILEIATTEGFKKGRIRNLETEVEENIELWELKLKHIILQ